MKFYILTYSTTHTRYITSLNIFLKINLVFVIKSNLIVKDTSINGKIYIMNGDIVKYVINSKLYIACSLLYEFKFSTQ